MWHTKITRNFTIGMMIKLNRFNISKREGHELYTKNEMIYEIIIVKPKISKIISEQLSYALSLQHLSQLIKYENIFKGFLFLIYLNWNASQNWTLKGSITIVFNKTAIINDRG